jgi:hypothetical protein
MYYWIVKVSYNKYNDLVYETISYSTDRDNAINELKRLKALNVFETRYTYEFMNRPYKPDMGVEF